MSKFTVHMTNVVSAAVDVEATDLEAAIEVAFNSPGMPGAMTVGAFGSSPVDDSGWEPASVEDASGEEVWSERT